MRNLFLESVRHEVSCSCQCASHVSVPPCLLCLKQALSNERMIHNQLAKDLYALQVPGPAGDILFLTASIAGRRFRV